MRGLGRPVRPYLATVGMGATAGIGEHPLVFVDHGIALLRLAVIVTIWRAILVSDAAPTSPAPGAVLTYVLLARVLAEQLDARTAVVTTIWEGSVASRLLRPVSVFGDYLSEMAGSWALRWATFSIPALALGLLLGVSILPASGARFALAVLGVGLSVAVGTAFDFLFALLVVRAPESMWALRYSRDALVPLVSGAVIPLPLFPWNIGEVLSWLPFASMVAAPLRIYTGEAGAGRMLALQVLWAAGLWALARRAWRASAPRMVSFGG